MGNLGEYLGAGSTVTQGLYHLNGNSNDASGNGNDGTWTGTAVYSDGRFGQGADFNRTTNRYISIANQIQVSSEATFSLWINWRALGQLTGIISKRGGGFNNWQIYNTGGLLSGLFWHSGGAYTLNYSESNFSTGIWYHILYTYVGGGTTRLYVNGISVASLSTPNNLLNQNCNTRIGEDNNTNRVNAIIDEVIIENRAWTATEVQKYYTCAKGRFGII